MTDVGTPFYPQAWPGTVVLSWEMCRPGNIRRVVTVGATPDGWWVAANWHLGGRLYGTKAAAIAQAEILREMVPVRIDESPVNPGEWAETSVVPVTLPG